MSSIPKPRQFQHLPEIILCFIFLSISAVLWWKGLSPVEADTPTYIGPAETLLRGYGFGIATENGFSATVHRTPGYSLYLAPFLALFGSKGLQASVLMQKLLLCTIVFWLPAVRKSESPIYSFMGKAILLLSPLMIVNSSYGLSDTLFLVFVFYGLYALGEGSRRDSRLGFAVAGVLLGCATWVRPVGLYLPIVLTGALVVLFWRLGRPARIRLLFPFLLLYSLFPLAWAGRNYLVTGTFGYSPLTGYNLLLHRESLVQKLEISQLKDPKQVRLLTILKQEKSVPKSLDRLQAEDGLNEFEADGIAKSIAVPLVLHHPVSYVRQSIFHALNLFLSPADDFVFLASIFGDREAFSKPLGAAVRERDIIALFLHASIRLLHFAFYLLVPIALLIRFRNKLDADRLVIHLVAGLYFVAVTALVIPTYARLLMPLFVLFLFAFNPPPAQQAPDAEPQPAAS